MPPLGLTRCPPRCRCAYAGHVLLDNRHDWPRIPGCCAPDDKVRDDGVPPAAPFVATLPKPAVVAPLAPTLYKVQFTISREAHDTLRRVQGLMRHTNPKGDPAVIFERALTLLLADLERRKLGDGSSARDAADRSWLSSHSRRRQT